MTVRTAAAAIKLSVTYRGALMISDPAALTAELNDPSTPTQRLVDIAGAFPEFGPLVAEHPNATVDVLSYLLKHGDDVSRKAAARRRARDVALITAQQAAPTPSSTPAAAPASMPAAAPTPVPDNAAERSEDNLTVPIEPLRESVPTAHARPEQSFARPALPAQAAQAAQDSDETRLSQRSQQRTWRFTIEGNSDVVFSGTDVLVGRKPSSRADLPQAQLVTIPDPTKTVSKTHARMVFREEQWVVVDLDSTNGVFVESPRGEHRIVPGSEIVLSATFSLGDLRVTISETDSAD